MNLTRRRFSFSAVAAVATAALFSSPNVLAQEFPISGKPIRLVVPFSPGGLTDIVSRRIGEGLSAELGVPVIPDNKPGASGIPAIASLSGAPADGHTLYVGYLASHATNASLYTKLTYDPVKDFTPVGLIADSPLVATINPKLPFRTLAELVTYAKANPGKLNFASTGIGGPSHLAMELLKHEAGIDIVHVPYRGTAQVVPDLVSGVIQGYFDALLTAKASMEAGRVRGVAITTSERMATLPDVPTARENDVDLVLSTWFGLLAYGQISPEARDKLATALNRVVASDDFARWCEERGLRPLLSTPDEFTKFMAAETERLGKVVKSANIRIE